MRNINNKINELVKASRDIIKDCCFPNGAIVASNSSKPYYPKEAKNYKFVWPRDASYTCIAANMLGMKIQEKFFEWCMRAQGWNQTGLFYEKYYINGKKALQHLQPDQTGSILIAIHDYCKNNEGITRKFERLIRKSADALCRIWVKKHFKLIAQDLWEERLCFPDLNENFSYSLAICSRGLFCANELIPNQKWLMTGNDMKRMLLSKFDNYFYRSFGEIDDKSVDASLLGLVWPSHLVEADDYRMNNTIRLIENKIVKNFGVYRYENDEYDGWMYKKTIHRKKGAGYWPLLNFWMAIYYLEKGNKKKALKYYNKVVEDIGNKKFIPEQIFNNKIQISISPLCWAHSMFIIASNKLGYIKI